MISNRMMLFILSEVAAPKRILLMIQKKKKEIETFMKMVFILIFKFKIIYKFFLLSIIWKIEFLKFLKLIRFFSHDVDLLFLALKSLYNYYI